MVARTKPAASTLQPARPARAGRRARVADRELTIVGVGASSGGLEAFRQLLADVPADAGLAFVLVQHLDATRASLLSDALAPATRLRVAQAEQGERVEPNRVYVIPPGTQLTIEAGVLRLAPLDEDERRPHLPIDHFLRSLAADRGPRAVGVVLSGTASDGTAGLAAVRAEGGVTFAQDPRQARFPEMPQSALDAGVVDFCLPLPALGAALAGLALHPALARRAPPPPSAADTAALEGILALVQAATGVDFGEYKPDTVWRRLARRMAVRQAQDAAAYLALLRQDPAEVAALHEDLLIKVTSFFRDEPFFDELRTVALPDILKHKSPGAPIRAWVVGCATGEEVYSLAIEILEHLGGGPPAHPILIFGSDASEKAIARARAGVYPDAVVRGLGEERLERFFVRTERGWRVAQAVRDLCVFVRHDVARDPPFSRLDLLCCRNVLIYFRPALQRRVLATAHYCLEQPGYLLLGRSESAAGVPRWFAATSRGGRVFRRRPGPSAYRFAPRGAARPFAFGAPAAPEPAPSTSGGGLRRRVDDLVLARYGPAGVVVNERLEVLQLRGRTDPYLQLPEGEPRLLLFELLRPGLAAPLRVALARARRTGAPIRKEGVALGGEAAGRSCDLVVLPVRGTEEGEQAFVVLFEEHPAARPDRRAARPRGRGDRGDRTARHALEEELASTKEYAAALLEEHGRGTEALASANDELVSANEELQSLNEELETAKEELQATNEELTTLNDELNGRNRDLQAVNADVLNLLDAVELPILMLDEERRIRRFTRQAATFMKLAPADVGRPITDLLLPFEAPDLEPWIVRSMEEGTLVEAEVQDRAGRWHRLQIRPHRTVDGRTDGAILALADIQALKQELLGARWARDYARGIVEAVQVPLVVLDVGLRVLSANGAYYRLFREAPGDVEGRGFFELGAREWDSAELRRTVAEVIGSNGPPQVTELERELFGAGRRAVSVSACAIPALAGEPMLLLAIEDVTARRQLEQHRAELLQLAEEARRRAEEAGLAKDLFLANLSHELRTPLTSILLQADLLQLGRADPAAVSRAAAAIAASTQRQVRLVADLLDVSRIVAGKLSLELQELDWRGLVEGVVEAARPEAVAKGVELTAELDGAPLACRGDPGRLQQVVVNLLGNALKFTPRGGRVRVRVEEVDGEARLTVDDTGRGISPAFLPHVFDRFAQEQGGGRQGLGLGLAIAHQLVALHGGSLRAESPGEGRGATFTVSLPRLGAGARA
ncbi:MAG TPA: chemotaxis protein CheB [Anaeromyxobacteraceae bacterium]|nr:chemotaxis protein CheB [Anaeromyxobacteraceae bacterium]